MLNRLVDVFRSLREHEVRYLVVGGIAAILHGVPRATIDLDILIDVTPENARRLLAALAQAGLGTALLATPDELIRNEITIFKDRVRVDVLTEAPGLSFEAAWDRRETMTYQDQPFFVLSKDDLIAAKKASGRAVDLEDARLLELPDDPEG